MAGVEHAPDILSALPLWVQVTANLGMFFVAVVTAAWGFAKKRAAYLLPDEHFADGGQFHRIGEDLKDGIEALQSVAETLKAMLAIQQAAAQEGEIEREVQRRLKDTGHSRN